MKAFWYLLTVDRPFTETELPRVKTEICRVLECTDIRVSGDRHFKVHSRIAPDQLDGQIAELSDRFGAHFRAGGELG